ncbi:MAG: hypothetical protein FWE80_01455, partial [Oscillospiraceae bacterium]|nr:hypothetical protein [Oscillospiraceae bacterium]
DGQPAQPGFELVFDEWCTVTLEFDGIVNVFNNKSAAESGERALTIVDIANWGSESEHVYIRDIRIYTEDENGDVDKEVSIVFNKPGVIKEELEALIAEGDDIVAHADWYLQDTRWTQFINALATAKQRYEDPNATQSQVDNAAQTLRSTIDSLNPVKTAFADLAPATVEYQHGKEFKGEPNLVWGTAPDETKAFKLAKHNDGFSFKLNKNVFRGNEKVYLIIEAWWPADKAYAAEDAGGSGTRVWAEWNPGPNFNLPNGESRRFIWSIDTPETTTGVQTGKWVNLVGELTGSQLNPGARIDVKFWAAGNEDGPGDDYVLVRKVVLSTTAAPPDVDFAKLDAAIANGEAKLASAGIAKYCDLSVNNLKGAVADGKTIRNTATAQVPVDAAEAKINAALVETTAMRLKGDIDGDGLVKIDDARVLLQHLVGKKLITDMISLSAAKVDLAQTNLTVGDARVLLQFIVGKVTAL